MSLRKFTGYRLIPSNKITTDRIYHYERLKKRQPTALLYQPDLVPENTDANLVIYNYIVCLSPYQERYRNTQHGVYSRVEKLG